MTVLLNVVINHILSFAEKELIKDEPEIIEALENELKIFITKIEKLIYIKSPNLAAIINPPLTSVESMIDDTISTSGNNLEKRIT